MENLRNAKFLTSRKYLTVTKLISLFCLEDSINLIYNFSLYADGICHLAEYLICYKISLFLNNKINLFGVNHQHKTENF